MKLPLLLVAYLTLTLPALGQNYHAKSLGSLGHGGTVVTAINTATQIVGSSNTKSHQIHAFYWDTIHGMQDMGTLPGMTSSKATGINDLSQAVGCSTSQDGTSSHVFFWTPGEGMEDIGSIVSGQCDVSINNLGQVVWSPSSFTTGHVFRWTQSGGAQDLGFSGYATATNASSQIAGTALFQGQEHAFLWSQAGGLQDLGTLNSWESSLAFGMNANGDVVGTSSPNVVPPQDAFVWTESQGMIGLGVSWGDAYAINVHGQAVGWGIFGPDLHPFFWSQGTGVIDIDSELPAKLQNDPHFWAAVGINDAGKIVLSDHISHGGGYLLTPLMKVTVTSSANPSHVGESVTFTASVTSVQGPPPNNNIERVTFKDGKKQLKSVVLSGGIATFTTSSLAAGTHSITAIYSGDINYASSKSPALQQVVNP